MLSGGTNWRGVGGGTTRVAGVVLVSVRLPACCALAAAASLVGVDAAGTAVVTTACFAVVDALSTVDTSLVGAAVVELSDDVVSTPAEVRVDGGASPVRTVALFRPTVATEPVTFPDAPTVIAVTTTIPTTHGAALMPR